MKSIDELCPPRAEDTSANIDENVTSELIEKMTSAIEGAIKENATVTKEVVEKFNDKLSEISSNKEIVNDVDESEVIENE